MEVVGFRVSRTSAFQVTSQGGLRDLPFAPTGAQSADRCQKTLCLGIRGLAFGFKHLNGLGFRV